jgi:hypothetical protein
MLIETNAQNNIKPRRGETERITNACFNFLSFYKIEITLQKQNNYIGK